MERLLTIGVYGWDADRWLAALQDAGCDEVVDIRARRGVRGREYAFANRSRLEERLAAAGIRYRYIPELAPARATRDAQTSIDKAAGVRKRERAVVGDAFIEAYRRDVLAHVDWTVVARSIVGSAPALLCVERMPAACHRSLAAARLSEEVGVKVEDLVP